MNDIEGEIRRAGLVGADATRYRELDTKIRLADRQKTVAPLSVAVCLCEKTLEYRQEQEGLIMLQRLVVK